MPETAPDPTAVRVALWRALHVELDAPAPVLDDRLGLELAAPGPQWRARPDMDPGWTRPIRASIAARARFVEDLVAERAAAGVEQCVILGAGLDTFAQRRLQALPRLRVFEVDRPGPQAWKRKRLLELGWGVPERLTLVPVDFEAGGSWRRRLAAAGFDAARPAVVASTGVSMYLTKEANARTLRDVAALASGSVFVMSFLRPVELVDEDDRAMAERAIKGAAASGTPFLSFFAPEETVSLSRGAGFHEARHVGAEELARLYFAGRTDGLRPSNGEELLVARV